MKTRFSCLGLCVVVCLGFANVACKSSGPDGNVQSTRLTGAGSTFVYPIMTRWIADFQKTNAGVEINYQSIGSGGGIQQLKQGLVDFGASDAALSDTQLKDMVPVIQLPESAGPVCITYNLPDLHQPLRLTGDILAGIYLGTIKTWHDAALKAANPGVTLPNVPVVVAHRSDGSGTTNIFTNYLAAVSPEWKQKVGTGTAVSWPTGLGGKGSEGVTGAVKQTQGAVGYVELTYAEENHLPVAVVENRAHNFVAPTAQSASEAVQAFGDKLAQDVRIPVVDPPAEAKDAYPISGLTYIMVPKDGADTARRAEVKKFLRYMVSDGQGEAAQLHYASLPGSIIDLDRKLIDGMTAKGQPIQQ